MPEELLFSGGILVQRTNATTRVENGILWDSDMVVPNGQGRPSVLTSCRAATTAARYPLAGNIIQPEGSALEPALPSTASVFD
jgi:hypothetical protein